jgi:lysine-N-methylase
MLELAQARYRCTTCGDCCRGWYVPLQPGEAEAFQRLAAPLVPAARLVGAIKHARHAGVDVDALVGPGGQCAALDEAQLCRVHAAHGEAAKPRACRIFPFTFVATPDAVRVGLSFACPAVLDGEGAPLAEQRGEIEALFAGAVDGTRYLLRLEGPIALSGGIALAWPDARRLLDALAAAAGEDGPLVRRLARTGALAALTQARLEEGAAFEVALDDARARRDALVDEALAERAASDRLSRALFRTLVKSTEPGEAGALARFGGAIASLFTPGEVRLRGRGGPDSRMSVVKWTAAERVAPGVGDAGEALLARFVTGALWSLTYFGDAAFGLPITAGLDLLVLSTAVAVFLARAYAADAGRARVAPEDLRAGLRQLDAGITHRSAMPGGFARALAATASLDLLREQLAV